MRIPWPRLRVPSHARGGRRPAAACCAPSIDPIRQPNRIRIALASLLLAAGLAHAGQYSDVWYDPQESGWGVNVVQQEENAFVTLFVYDPDGRPT